MARALEFDAGNRRWSLRFDINALCNVEIALGKTFFAAVEDMQQGGSITALRALFRAGLGNRVTEEEAGNLAEELGMARVTELLSQAFALAFPAKGEAETSAGN